MSETYPIWKPPYKLTEQALAQHILQSLNVNREKVCKFIFEGQDVQYVILNSEEINFFRQRIHPFEVQFKFNKWEIYNI